MDSEQVISEFIESLPKKAVPDIQETVIAEKTKEEARVVTQEAQVGNWSNVGEEVTEEETYVEDIYEEETYAKDLYEEETYEEEPSKAGMGNTEEQLYTEEPYYQEEGPVEEERPSSAEERGQGRRKKARYEYPASAPAPPLPEQDEGLSNMMMAWYYAGYYTGLYQVRVSLCI